MDSYFKKLLSRMQLTQNQQQDAKTKYTGVATALHNKYYDNQYTGDSKFLIGSYGKSTNIRPPTDIDMIFKIPKEVFEKYKDYASNGPSALLQDIRESLSERYTTTEKITALGKVVLVQFTEGSHNVEVLPAFDDGRIFIIPNTESGGSWEELDARAEINKIQNSHNESGGKTKLLVKLIKQWRNINVSLDLSSYEIEQLCIEYVDIHLDGTCSWSEVVLDFFCQLDKKHLSYASYISTAINRAQKAREYEEESDYKAACSEWRKVFGNNFPAYDKDLKVITDLTEKYPSNEEQIIEDLFNVNINPDVSLRIHAIIRPNKSGWRSKDWPLAQFLRRFGGLIKQSGLEFKVETDYEPPVEFYWKIRNFGEEAKDNLRGKIEKNKVHGQWKDGTMYHGKHYVECYMIERGVCIGSERLIVLIDGTIQDEEQ